MQQMRALVKTSFLMLRRTLLFTLPILAISTSLHGRGLDTYLTFSRAAFVTGPSARVAAPTNSLGGQARVVSGQASPGARPVANQETITRLQIFLDEHSFGPGKIDGRWSEFVGKALKRFQTANGRQPSGQILCSGT